jgi:hypothetical protein
MIISIDDRTIVLVSASQIVSVETEHHRTRGLRRQSCALSKKGTAMRPSLIAILVSGMHGVAFSDDAAPVAQPPDPSDPSISSTSETPPVTTPRWPRGVIDRPLTLPAQLGVAGFDVLGLSTVETTMMQTSSSLGWLASLAAGYGVTDSLEINAVTPNYTFALEDFEIKGALDLGVGYKLLRGAAGGKLEVIARAVAGYDLNASLARPIRLGVHAQYNITPKIAVFTHDIGLGNAGLSIAVDGESKPIGLTLPVGVGIQALPELWIEADTAPISMLSISDGDTQLISDVTPLLATAVYNLMAGHLDALGYFGFTDLQQAADTVTFGVGVRYYAGTVD